MKTWDEDDNILGQHHEINLINLTMNQIHNRRTDEHIKQEILDQVEPRYYLKGSQGDIEGLMYINSPMNETFRPFPKNFKITRMVIRACLGFLKPLTRNLLLCQQESVEFKYLRSEISDQHLAHGQLRDRDEVRHEHIEKYNNKRLNVDLYINCWKKLNIDFLLFVVTIFFATVFATT